MVMAYFKVLSHHLHGGTGGIYKNLKSPAYTNTHTHTHTQFIY